VRDVALRLNARRAHRRVHACRVENFESIHNHSAYAEIEGFGAARAEADRHAETRDSAGSRIAVVGSGIAGLGSAHLLRRQGPRGHAVRGRAPFGGHTQHGRRHAGRHHPPGGHRLPGLQRPHLPELIALFAELGVEHRASDMSFSVQPRPIAGSSGAGTTSPPSSRSAQRCCARASGHARRHPALQPRDHGDRRARAPTARSADEPIGDFLDAGLSARVPRLVLAADGGCIWSCPTRPDAALSRSPR
jgi:hypothetical protein